MNWYLKVLQNYTNFKGRARRQEYWMFFLINFIISIILGIIDEVLKIDFLGNIYSLAVFLPSIAVAIRRAHDTNKSGWYILIPIYNIILMATEGDTTENEYGSDPKNEGGDFSSEIDSFGVAEKDINTEAQEQKD